MNLDNSVCVKFFEEDFQEYLDLENQIDLKNMGMFVGHKNNLKVSLGYVEKVPKFTIEPGNLIYIQPFFIISHLSLLT